MWKQEFLRASGAPGREAVLGFQPRGVIVCLFCGKTREPFGCRFLAECPACGDLGWADSAALSETELRLLSGWRRLTLRRRDVRAGADVVYASFAQRRPPMTETGRLGR